MRVFSSGVGLLVVGRIRRGVRQLSRRILQFRCQQFRYTSSTPSVTIIITMCTCSIITLCLVVLQLCSGTGRRRGGAGVFARTLSLRVERGVRRIALCRSTAAQHGTRSVHVGRRRLGRTRFVCCQCRRLCLHTHTYTSISSYVNTGGVLTLYSASCDGLLVGCGAMKPL